MLSESEIYVIYEYQQFHEQQRSASELFTHDSTLDAKINDTIFIHSRNILIRSLKIGGFLAVALARARDCHIDRKKTAHGNTFCEG